MNRHACFVAVALLVALGAGPAFAQIGENFEPAGISLWGGGSLYFNVGYFLDPDFEDFYWSFEVSPGFDLLFVKNLSFYVNPWVSFASDKYYDSGIPGTVVDKTLQFGLSGGLTYYLVRDPQASVGLVPAVGGGVGVWLDPDATDTLDGMDLTSDGLEVGAYLELVGRVYWFLNERLAPYVGVTPRAYYEIYYRDWDGTVWDGPFRERLMLDVSVAFGVSYWIPNKQAALFARR
jgi:hypothetical protein